MAMQMISFQVPSEVLERLHTRAALEGRDDEAVLLEAVDEYLIVQEQRDVLTLEAIEDVDRHGTIPHDEVVAWSRNLSSSGQSAVPEPKPASHDTE